MERFEKTFTVRWADVDANGHMRHSAYADYGADVRIALFVDQGLGPDHFFAVGIAPVLLKEELEYLKEMKLSETFQATCTALALSPDGARWRLLHEFLRGDGRLAARIVATGGWIDLKTRRLSPATPEMVALMNALPRAPEFEELRSLGRF
jgi:acyl-CoA thioester hydrolase